MKLHPGMKVGRLELIRVARVHISPCGTPFNYWACLCDCGKAAEVRAAHLCSARIRSCGCLRKELARIQKTTHGQGKTHLYDVWVQMIQRCTNPNNKRFESYGGRGIKVCPAWRRFEAFEADMAEGYAPGLYLDRKNNDKGYSPGNCKWSTAKESGRNTRRTVYLEWQGKKVPMAELAEAHGLKYMTLYRRIQLRKESLPHALRAPGAK